MQIKIKKIEAGQPDRLLLDIDIAMLALCYLAGSTTRPLFMPMESLQLTVDEKVMPWPDWANERG